MLLPCVADAFDSHRSSSKPSAVMLLWAAPLAKADLLLDADRFCRNESRERTAWNDALEGWSAERAQAGCSPDDLWDCGIKHPAKFLQALCGVPYSAELGGGISGWRCRRCHSGQTVWVTPRDSFQERHRSELQRLGLRAGPQVAALVEGACLARSPKVGRPCAVRMHVACCCAGRRRRYGWLLLRCCGLLLRRRRLCRQRRR